MADAQQQQQDEDLILSFFPDPPHFYRHFTAENLERLKQLKNESAASDEENDHSAPQLSLEQILALPTELRYLVPPEPPADDEEFNVFGTTTRAKGTDLFTKNMEWISSKMKEQGVLEDWKYEQLYPSSTPANDASTQPSATTTLDPQKYLYRLLRSILLSYMSLLGIVAMNPISPAKDEKLADILTMVTNMHALINQYRPHQARETLIGKMEDQVRKKKQEVEGVRSMREKVRGVLEGFGRDVPREKEETQILDDFVVSVQEKTNDVQKHMWVAMDEILGQ
ncbi:MED7 protein-domain-containing protein [Pyrenochaeta sp. MPI-SDFR-AT-0127]|nr:MED7 protein-domain-containing protein [Pyrenochaeta sp. MPI-SDFR-AT-0127]